MKLTKDELIKAIAAEGNMSHKAAAEALAAVVGAVQSCLTTGNDVSIPNFGVFELRKRAPRSFNNPTTRQPYMVPAKRGVRFRPSTALKKAVAES